MDLKNFDPVQHSGLLPSPCINICQMNPENNLCVGCHRTLEEISNWSVAPESKKMQIWMAIKERRSAA